MTAAGLVLTRLAQRYRLERSLGLIVLWASIGVIVSGVAHWFGAPDTVRWTLLITLAFVGLVLAWWRDRREQVTALSVAQHLDRRLPELEESAALLLDLPGRSPLDILQRQRVLQRWDAARAAATLPHDGLGRSLLIGLPLIALGFWLSRGTIPMHGSKSAWSRSGDERVTLQRLEVAIVPPAYTGADQRTMDASDGIEAEEGAALTWELRTAGSVHGAWLLLSKGDSLPFAPSGDGAWILASHADRSQLVRVRLTAADSLSLLSDDYRIAVRRDKPPALTILEPAERTVIPAGKLPKVPVTVHAIDDYGVDQITLNATIASGRGEAVRFRRLQLALGARTRDPVGGERAHGTIDLPALGMGPGDELYFYVEATDRRAPIANHARSETVFLSIADTTTTVSADVAKLALNAQPEYFRSQRQLIIDTEKLLAEQARISNAVFRDRSNEIGIDQGLLRLRYGQFLGEEFEEQSSEMGGREHAASEAAELPPTKESTEGNKATTVDKAKEQATAGLTHKHDDAENATLLGNRVKGMLRDAVSAMWQAELHLRTAEPKRALPYMNQALDLIKQIQQDARVYVQRVGFEPPPIEVDKLRLSGKLAGISDRRIRGEEQPSDSLPAIHRALELVGSVTGDSLADALQDAGEELSEIALQDPRLLPVLKAVRELLDATRRKAACSGCTARVEHGLWAALPLPEPRPGFGTLPASPLGRRYSEMMRGTR